MSTLSEVPGRLPTRIGADIGGTFTDIASIQAGRLRVGKRLTTHGSEGDGIIQALTDAQVPLTDAHTVLAHGHTLVINALLERKGARTALVTTQGFGDILDVGRGSRPEMFNFRYRRDPVLIPPERRFELPERAYADGEIAVAPSEADLDALVKQLGEARIEAVAVALLNSYVQPANERQVRDYLQAALPEVAIVISSDLSRQWREFERFSTAAANAYVAPVAERYVVRLIDDLKQRGFNGEFVILDSSGGALSVDMARRYPVRTVESGPVAGVLAARDLATRLGFDNVATFDMGGTTAKSCLVEAGRFASTELYWINGFDRGFPLQIHCIDVTEVGAGGGSIAWIDESGRLRVGPRSASSHPGPASYGFGGTDPTVTDANVYCGRLDTNNFVGSLTLDADAARDAIDRLGRTLGMASDRLALGILKLANLSMAAAVRRQTIERGRDPREFALIAYGGAGPMHACEVAAEVGITRVVIPRFPGHFSAIGMLGVNLRFDRREIFRAKLDELDGPPLSAVVARIGRELEVDMQSGSALDHVHASFSYSLALRYAGQDHTLMIPARTPGLLLDEDFAVFFRNKFEAEYLRRYGHADPQAAVEVVELEVVVERQIGVPQAEDYEFAPGSKSQIMSRFSLETQPVMSEVTPRVALTTGGTFSGPMIVYEEGATTVLPPGVTGEVAPGGELLLDTAALC